MWSGFASHLWLEISMADLPLVQDDQSFEDLRGDLSGLHPGTELCNILAQVAVLDILHRDVDGVSIDVFEPPGEGNKQFRMLVLR